MALAIHPLFESVDALYGIGERLTFERLFHDCVGVGIHPVLSQFLMTTEGSGHSLSRGRPTLRMMPPRGSSSACGSPVQPKL
jgi:hypothetical protein